MKTLIKIALEDVSKCFKINEDLYNKYFEGEILLNQALVDLINLRNGMGDWQEETPLGGPGTVLNAVVLYCLIRHYGLEFVLETGVSGGYYSSFILAAVYHDPDQNSIPLVRSLELSDDLDEVGKLVPDELQRDWECLTGIDSVTWLKDHGKGWSWNFQLYCHDSLHTMSHMLKELNEFKKCEEDRFFIYVDDQNSDNFWQKCLQMGAFKKPGYDVVYISGAESRLQGHLGGFLKYEKTKN
jgi:hypothetical protein